MPRINIEEKLWSDRRFISLCMKIGDPWKALGMLCFAWHTAQKYLEHGIPIPVWESQGFGNEIIECDLATKTDEFVVLKGSNEHFKWLSEFKESGRLGGLASARRRESLRKISSESKRIQPSSSSSFSNTNTNTDMSKTTFSQAPDGAMCPSSKLIEYWNTLTSGLPKVRGLNNERKRKLLARWKEHPNLDEWIEVIKKINVSKFCRGENSSGWRASFDFLLRQGTFLKTLEGNYDGKQSESYEWIDIRPEETKNSEQ